jgi:two-component system response regulator PrrA
MASVSSADDLIRVATELRPDIVVSDLDMPVHGGLDVMLALKTLGVEIPFVLMGTETEAGGAAEFLEQGAAAYVHKFDLFADLIEAVLVAVSSHKFLSRSVAHKMS